MISPSMSVSFPTHIDKLTGENWFAWKTKITPILELHGVLSLLNTLPDQRARAHWDAEHGRPFTWNRCDALARTLILVNISDDQVVYVSNAKTAYEMWKNLTSVYDAENHPNIPLLREKLYTCRVAEGGDILKHLEKLKARRRRLHMMGYCIPEEDFKWIILNSLPGSWSSFVEGVADDVKSQELIYAIEEEYEQRGS